MSARRQISRAALASALALSLFLGVRWRGAGDYARPEPTRPSFAENFDFYVVRARMP